MQKKEEQQPRITGSNGACAREKSERSARGGIGEDAGRGGEVLLQQLCGRIIACDDATAFPMRHSGSMNEAMMKGRRGGVWGD